MGWAGVLGDANPHFESMSEVAGDGVKDRPSFTVLVPALL